MAVCNWCWEEMEAAETISCGGNDTVKYEGGKKLAAIIYLGEGRCRDCNIAPGGYHHPGCDMEKCPDCGGQLKSCGCITI